MTDYTEIYNKQAQQYELLVSREDYQHNILRALQQMVPLEGAAVVELGAGTGRLTCILVPLVKSITAFDRSAHMLNLARQKLLQSGLNNWFLEVGEHQHVNVLDGSVDVLISGWSICYVAVENPAAWQAELETVLSEMQRVLLPGGYIILLETLGTGFEEPNPPVDLLTYFAYLEARGFQRTWIRTDYCFQNRAEAEGSARFFFGEEMIAKIREDERGVILPECTGIWWLIKE
ncbi:MAG: class I SAM-dependent methyltransferase [Chloroflexi bacterium HGW-Chloroflexi-10]|nr:MAG: class I SAM-dependent methyltransferase [Chloroflexi bacterium HGW-Chloroflexi-10]